MTSGPARAPNAMQRRRARTRTAILEAGQQLFAARAMDSVSVDEIVAAADVAKGSFYNHFEDKIELAGVIVAQVQQDCELHIAIANKTVPDPAERVTRALCVMVQYALDHPDRIQALLSLSERRNGPDSLLNAGVVRDIKEGLARKRFCGVTVESGLLIIIGLTRMLVTHAVAQGSATSPAELAASIGAAMLRALGLQTKDAKTIADAASAGILQAPKK